MKQLFVLTVLYLDKLIKAMYFLIVIILSISDFIQNEIPLLLLLQPDLVIFQFPLIVIIGLGSLRKGHFLQRILVLDELGVLLFVEALYLGHLLLQSCNKIGHLLQH